MIAWWGFIIQNTMPKTITTYAIRFDQPDSNGNIIKKGAVKTDQFEKLKASGNIIDFEIDHIGVKVTKSIKNFASKVMVL